MISFLIIVLGVLFIGAAILGLIDTYNGWVDREIAKIKRWW